MQGFYKIKSTSFSIDIERLHSGCLESSFSNHLNSENLFGAVSFDQSFKKIFTS